jgi:large subunit ribosomal protein L27
MAHKKGVGSSDNGRDSLPKYLGVKMFGGQYAKAGNILIRQRGTKFHAGENTYLGKDHTVHAAVAGVVGFKRTRDNKRVVFVTPIAPTVVEEKALPKVEAKKEVAPKATPLVEAVATPVEVATAETPVVETPAPTPVAVVEEATAPKKGKKEGDDLKKIEGIGPKIAELLNNAGIMTFAQLSETSVDSIKAILEEAGSRFSIHNPSTWPKQAGLAAKGKWDELKALQDELDGGKE